MVKIPNQTGRAKAKAAEVIEQAHDLINEALPELTQSLIDSALGIRFQDEKGNVYTKEPNVESLKRCLEIVMGKPVAKVENTLKADTQGFEDWIRDEIERTALPPVTHGTIIHLSPGETLHLPSPAISAAKERMEDVLAELGIDS